MSTSDASRTTTMTQTRRSAPCPGRGLKIMQEQVGHDHASTTSIYTCVSSDYRTRTLRRALDDMVAEALGATQGGRQ
jgi:hypothetical protein